MIDSFFSAFIFHLYNMNEVYRKMNEPIDTYMLHKNNISKRSLKIIDIYDYYLIVTPNNKQNTLEKALDMYKEMDIQAEVTDTPFEINKNTLDFIASICGTCISNSKITTVPKLIEELTKMIEFHDLQMSWTSYKVPSSTNIPTPTINQSTRKAPPPLPIPSSLKEIGCYEANTSQFSLLDDTEHIHGIGITSEENVFIVYNTLYNISLVVKEDKSFFEHVCQDFTEFHILASLPLTTHEYDIYQQAKTFFHQKMFDEEADLEKKVNAFNALYNISPIATKEAQNEKEEVQNFMKHMFDFSSDPKERMKAVDLYQKVSSLLPGMTTRSITSEASLYKRLAIYFMDMGLIRKRFTDGVYYYGIKFIKRQDITAISIEDMMMQRKYDKIKSRSTDENLSSL